MVLILKTLGMRALSWALGAWLSPVGKILIIGAVAAGGYWGWQRHIKEQGASEERAKWEESARKGTEKALSDRALAQRWLEEQSMDDLEFLRRMEAEEERVRNENPGDGVLWRADDGWLRSKGRAPAGSRSRSGAVSKPRRG